MGKITLAYFVLIFILYRPFQLQDQGLIYGGDDYSYLAYATSISFLEYPSFQKEYFDESNIPPLSRVGPGLMMLPFVAPLSLVDRIVHPAFAERRTLDGIRTSWSLFGAIISAVVYFWLALLFLYKTLLSYFKKSTVEWSLILFVLFQGTMLYVIRRPVFSHVYEFFLQSSLVALCFNKEIFKNSVLAKSVLTVLACSFSMLVRQNALIFAVLWPLLIFEKNIKASVAVVVSAFAVYYGVKYYPFILNKAAYEQANALFESTSFLSSIPTPGFILNRMKDIFVGIDWGLIFTAPFLILSAFSFTRLSKGIKARLAIASLPLFVNLYIVIIWKGQGSRYGYRFLLFSAIPILIFSFAAFFEMFQQKYGKKSLFILGAISILPLLSMLLFEAKPELGLQVITNKYGEHPWSNPNYQLNLWSQILHHPFESLYYLLKTGPAYLIYLVFMAVGMSNKLPSSFFNVYPHFNGVLMIKTLTIYLLPLILYQCFKKFLMRSPTSVQE